MSASHIFTPEFGMLCFIILCILLVAIMGKNIEDEPEPPPPGKVRGFTLRIELRDPVDPEIASQWAMATIDHLSETFNDDESIRYITYDVPVGKELPE